LECGSSRPQGNTKTAPTNPARPGCQARRAAQIGDRRKSRRRGRESSTRSWWRDARRHQRNVTRSLRPAPVMPSGPPADQRSVNPSPAPSIRSHEINLPHTRNWNSRPHGTKRRQRAQFYNAPGFPAPSAFVAPQTKSRSGSAGGRNDRTRDATASVQTALPRKTSRSEVSAGATSEQEFPFSNAV